MAEHRAVRMGIDVRRYLHQVCRHGQPDQQYVTSDPSVRLHDKRRWRPQERLTIPPCGNGGTGKITQRGRHDGKHVKG